MRRIIAIIATAFLTFFLVTFGMRFADSSMKAFLTAQLSSPQIITLPDSFDSPLVNIFPAPDGNMWVTKDGWVLRVKSDNTVENAFPTDGPYTSYNIFYENMVVFAGKLWVEACGLDENDFVSCRLLSFAPDGTVKVINGPYGPDRNNYKWILSPGPDGLLWGYFGPDVFKISPEGWMERLVVTPNFFIVPEDHSASQVPPAVYQGKMTKGGDGNMWVVLQSYDYSINEGSTYIGSVTPQGVATIYPVPKPADMLSTSIPTDLILGPDGNIWYTLWGYNLQRTGQVMVIGKMLPDGTTQHFPQSPGFYTGQLIAAPDGNIWFSYRSSATTVGIGKITSQGEMTLIPVADERIPSKAAVGADGNIWFISAKYVSANVAEMPYLTVPDPSSYKISKIVVPAIQSSSSGIASSSKSSSKSSVIITTATSSSRSSSLAFVAGDRCGNGILNSGEVCDDGNADGGDGCSSSCTQERGYACSGTSCYGVCGDGIIIEGEQCDDNNRRSGDGCSAACLQEAQSAAINTNPSFSSTTCGNGALNSGETCDDGNKAGGDGCSAQCVMEDGYSCYLSACVPTCGDGKVRGSEQCDDANRRSGDGCSDFCRLEPGYSCAGTKCVTACGDGIPLGAEQCDDGNTRPGDGCFSCREEAGWYCGGRPSQCYRYPFLPPVSSPSAAPSVSSNASATPISVVTSSSSSSIGAISSTRSSEPFLLPDWSFNLSSNQSSSVRFFSRASVTSSSDVSSSESSESNDSSQSSDSSSSVESSASSVGPFCGNGLLEGNEECDAGSLNGTPVSQCDVACTVLKPAAAESSASVSSQGGVAQDDGGGVQSRLLLMIMVALSIIVIGGVVAYAWFKFQQKVPK